MRIPLVGGWLSVLFLGAVLWAAGQPEGGLYEVTPFEFIFPETDPDTLPKLLSLRVTLAQEEFEPCTFAVRSNRAVPEVTARIHAPRRGQTAQTTKAQRRGQQRRKGGVSAKAGKGGVRQRRGQAKAGSRQRRGQVLKYHFPSGRR